MSMMFPMLDLVEELRLRRWARENYVPADSRSPDWHLVVHDEMSRRDQEMLLRPVCRRQDFVPLESREAPIRGRHSPAAAVHTLDHAPAIAELHYH